MRAVLLLVLVLGLVLAGCSGGNGSHDERSGGGGGTSAVEPSATAGGPLQILVTNDDGVGAPGIDVLVNALRDLPDVEVAVVAPAKNQSGSSDVTTPHPTHEPAKTASGVKATAVDGKPADAVLVALDDLGLEPDVVISGDNSVQNIGPGVELSGTVGAARTAARRGIPAVAVSQGFADQPDYEASVALVVDWLKKNRAALADGSAAVEVVNFNAPTCSTGEVRGLVEVPVDTAGKSGGMLDAPNCTSSLAHPTSDIEAFLNGFATMSVVGH